MLGEIRVLILIHEDIAELLPVFLGQVGAVAQQEVHKEEYVVEVHGIGGMEALIVEREDAGRHGTLGLAVAVAVIMLILLRRHHRVLGIADCGADAAGLVYLLIEAEILDYHLYERLGVGGIVDGESALEADSVGIVAEYAEENGVECSCPEARGHTGSYERGYSPGHLAGCLVGEGKGEDALGFKTES